MTAALTLSCGQVDCPLLENGLCLENFADPADCPHSFEAIAESPDQVDAASITVDDVSELDSPSPAREDVVAVGGDEALDLDGAEALVASRPTVVVLIAGEAESGKTTLIVELYARFLEGPFADWKFAGSRTLMALDNRHGPARVSSGLTSPTTERTQDEDSRLLHLEVGRETRRVNLLLSDLRGELFENVSNGARASKEVPLAGRADSCVILVDGARLETASGRALAASHARQLIGGLSEDGLRTGTRTLILCSKGDLIPKSSAKEVGSLLGDLVALAVARGLDAISMTVSARPEADGGSTPVGLAEVLLWLTEAQAEVAVPPVLQNAASDRDYWVAEVVKQ